MKIFSRALTDILGASDAIKVLTMCDLLKCSNKRLSIHDIDDGRKSTTSRVFDFDEVWVAIKADMVAIASSKETDPFYKRKPITLRKWTLDRLTEYKANYSYNYAILPDIGELKLSTLSDVEHREHRVLVKQLRRLEFAKKWNLEFGL